MKKYRKRRSGINLVRSVLEVINAQFEYLLPAVPTSILIHTFAIICDCNFDDEWNAPFYSLQSWTISVNYAFPRCLSFAFQNETCSVCFVLLFSHLHVMYTVFGFWNVADRSVYQIYTSNSLLNMIGRWREKKRIIFYISRFIFNTNKNIFVISMKIIYKF